MQIFSLGFVALAFLALFFANKAGQRQTDQDPTPEPEQQETEFVLPNYTRPPLTPEGKVDYQSAEVQKAVQSKASLSTSLPIYIEEFQTSTDISTTINIYSLPQDPDYLIRIDIYRIDYQNQETDESNNPNVTAFKESFTKARSLLEKNGVDIKDVYFVFGGRQYIQETAELWIETFNLMESSR